MTTRLSSLKDGRAKLVTNVGGGEEDRDHNMRASSSSSQVEGEPTPNGEVEEGEGEEGYSEPIVVKTLRSASLDATIHISNFHGLEQDEYQIREYSLPVSHFLFVCLYKLSFFLLILFVHSHLSVSLHLSSSSSSSSSSFLVTCSSGSSININYVHVIDCVILI